MANDEVLTFSPAGQLVRTERAVQAGNDGLVIMPDGTKYMSSVLNGGISRIRAGTPAELIARNIPNAASMCYDAGASQLVSFHERQQRARVRAAGLSAGLRPPGAAPGVGSQASGLTDYPPADVPRSLRTRSSCLRLLSSVWMSVPPSAPERWSPSSSPTDSA